MSEQEKVNRSFVRTNNAPAAIGPYNQAVLVDRTLYISAQLPLDPLTMEIVGRQNGSKGDISLETTQIFQNMEQILHSVGATFNNVIKTTVFITDMNEFATVNEIYKTYFSSNFPARSVIQVAALPKGALIKIEAIAFVGPIEDSS